MTAAAPPMPLSTSGRYIVDAHGRRVRLAGVNWYGAHEDDGVVSGLDRTDRAARPGDRPARVQQRAVPVQPVDDRAGHPSA